MADAAEKQTGIARKHSHKNINLHEGDAKHDYIKSHVKIGFWKSIENNIVIDPDTVKYHYWRMFIMALQMLSSFAYSFFAAFRRDLNFNSYDEYASHEQFTNKNHQFSKGTIEAFNTFTLVVELIFLVEIVCSSITSYTDEHERKITDLSKIRKMYFETGFVWDLVAIIPFTSLLHFENISYMFLIKCIRINEAFYILDVNNFNRELKRIYKKDHDKVCSSDMADDKIVDHNFVVEQFLIKYAFISVRLCV